MSQGKPLPPQLERQAGRYKEPQLTRAETSARASAGIREPEP